MSRHEGVSCDSCLKSNFRGRRYKCLICFDYDLCAACYENGAATNRHTTDHPMQCIITRSDFELYYGGEALPAEQPQAFTCPYCGKMGYTEASLHEHVTSDHSDCSFEVVCPICASVPGGDPNHLTDDFAHHLTIDHRGGTRDIDDTPSSRHNVRRMSHSGRGVGPRSRRSNMHFSSSSGLTSLSPSNRDSMDPIAELLSQLSGVRRTTTQSGNSAPGQLQQLQMQLQFERQQAQAARQHIERMPRRQGQAITTAANNPTSNSSSSATAVASIINQPAVVSDNTTPPQTTSTHPQCLLSRCTDSPATEAELQLAEVDRADKALFVQELLLATLADPVSQVISVDSENKVAEVKSNREDKDKKNCVQSRSPRVGVSPPPSLTNNCGSQQKPALTKRGRGGGGGGGVGSVGVGGGSNIGLVNVNRSPGGSTLNSSRAYYNPVSGNHVRMNVTGTGTVREVPQNIGGNRGALRNPSPGSSRRKITRPLFEGRNQSSEPSPPH